MTFCDCFFDWLDSYHEAHFAVIREIHKNQGPTRHDIWVAVYGDQLPREDSAKADLYRMLIRDLSRGGVIRQARRRLQHYEVSLRRYGAVCSDRARFAVCALYYDGASSTPESGACYMNSKLALYRSRAVSKPLSTDRARYFTLTRAQNGVAERWVESCRHDLLDHVIAFNEAHLKRLLSDYVGYYHDDRTHLGLGKNTPNRRLRSAGRGRVRSWPRLGGLHHRYERAA